MRNGGLCLLLKERVAFLQPCVPLSSGTSTPIYGHAWIIICIIDEVAPQRYL